MQAGQFRHVIDIEGRAEQRDSLGAVDWRYTTAFAGIRARVLRMTGEERMSTTEVQGQFDANIWVRFRPGITEKMRVRHVSDKKTNQVDYYTIEAIVPMGTDRRKILLLCRSYSADGNLIEPTLPKVRYPE